MVVVGPGAVLRDLCTLEACRGQGIVNAPALVLGAGSGAPNAVVGCFARGGSGVRV